MKYYYCEKCGNLLEVILDSNVKPLCCGEEMKILVADSEETASLEKHIPVVCKEGDVVKVKVGGMPHPMSSEHYIEFIELETDQGVYRKEIKFNDAAEAEFVLKPDENVVNAYAYCNIHGLWVA